MKRLFTFVLVFSLVFSLALAAEDTIKLRSIGRSPLTPPVTDVITAKQIVKNHIDYVRALESNELILDLLAQFEKSDFEPESIPVGAVMSWMLFRDRNGIVRNIKNVEWAGEKDLQGFGFRITHNHIVYHFFLPKGCGNLCLFQAKMKQIPNPVIPPSQPEPQKPVQVQEQPKPIAPPKPAEQPKPAEPQQPIKPKPIPPAIPEKPTPKESSEPSIEFIDLRGSSENLPNFKIKFGPWIPWEPLTFSFNNQNINIEHNFNEYLPKYEKFITCENGEVAILLLKEKSYTQQTGDSVWLKQNRSLSTFWSGININIGAELRLWNNFWLGADYYQSRKFNINVFEFIQDMYFKEVEYVGYITGPDTDLSGCPPKYHTYRLTLNRRNAQIQTNYSIVAKELNLVLRYYLTAGRFSLAPAVGIVGQQYIVKTKNDIISTILYPFNDEVISQSETSVSTDKNILTKTTWIADLTAEIRILKFLSVAAQGSYRKFPQKGLEHISQIHPALETNFESKPWRGTVTLKIVF